MWRRGCSSFRIVSGLTLVTFALGCTTWKRPQVAPEQAITNQRPEHVRLILSNSAQLELWHPQISNDSVVGIPARVDTTQSTGVPLSEIKEVQVRGVSAGKSVLLAAGLGVTVLLIAAAVSEDQEYFRPSPDTLNSCPFVYSWDGSRWRLDSGTFGGAIMPALARTDVDNLLYPRVTDGTMRLRVVNESQETDYLDYLAVLAVDHRRGTSVVPDGEGRVHSVVAPQAPITAADFRGGDVLARVRRSDGWAWESSPSGRDSSRAADVRDGIELSFPRPQGATSARLLVDASNTAWAELMMARFVAMHGTATQAWYDSVAADRRLVQRLGRMMAREVYLRVAVKVEGRWEDQDLVREAGPEVGKQQIVELDLSRVQGNTVSVRLESAPSLWLVDRVAIDYSAPESFTAREIGLSSAVDKLGHDVVQLLNKVDAREYVMERGEGAELTLAVPPVPSGKGRSYVLVTRGWYRLDVPATAEPQFALLERVVGEPLAGSRLITGDLARAVLALNQR